jgi:hypothetical protein
MVQALIKWHQEQLSALQAVASESQHAGAFFAS